MEAKEGQASAFPVPPNLYLAYGDAEQARDPPEIPTGTYSCFGIKYQVDTLIEVKADNTTEDAAGVTESATATEAAERLAELKRSYFTDTLSISDRLLPAALFLGSLNRETLRDFSALLGCLTGTARSDWEAKTAKLEKSFEQMHQHLSGFRPHQARETLTSIMSAQIDERDAMVAELMEQYSEIKASLRQWGLGVDASIES